MPAQSITVQRLTPVLIVDAIESCLPFWVDRLGFVASTQLPGDDGKLVFAILEKDGVEVMYQTRASVVAADPAQAGELDGHSIALFITVAHLDPVESALRDAPVVKPRHDTFYGSTEIYVREPGGNVVGFAEMKR